MPSRPEVKSVNIRVLRVVFATTFVLAVVGDAVLASTNVVTGSFATQVYGSDVPTLYVQDEGGGIGALRLQTFYYPNYTADPMSQSIQGFSFYYDPPIRKIEDNYTDQDGNLYRYSFWGALDDPWPGTIFQGYYGSTNSFTANLGNTFNGMPSSAGFPLGTVPPQIARYLTAGLFTQSDNEDIRWLAEAIVYGSTKEFQAVRRIIDWCVDYLTYTDPPPARDAYSILLDVAHRANCEGYSHMAIALARAVGIPARFVAGYSINQQYTIPGPPGMPPFYENHGQGVDDWLEVYYPDVGWVPYDATLGFYQYVDTHMYKVCVGIDAQQTAVTNWEYWYWPPEPILTLATSPSYYDLYENNGLGYCCTYDTPSKQAFADRIVHCTPVCITDANVAAGVHRDTLRWTGCEAPSYNIYRSDDCWGPYVSLGWVSRWDSLYSEDGAHFVYIDSTVTYSRPYFYKIEGGSDEAIASGTPLNLQQPTLPDTVRGLVASNVPSDCGYSISLSWQASSGADSYYVFRSSYGNLTDCTVMHSLIGRTVGTSYEDNNALRGVLYSYAVVARNESGSSESSGPDTAIAVREARRAFFEFVPGFRG